MRDSLLRISAVACGSTASTLTCCFPSVGSTVSAGSPLIDEAIKAAYKVKFSQSEQDIQVGTITYKFTLNTGAK